MNAATLADGTRRAVAYWPGWNRLPRDARDTLFLLAVIAWTVLPHASHLPAWSLSLSAAVLLWRGRLALINGALPGRWGRSSRASSARSTPTPSSDRMTP